MKTDCVLKRKFILLSVAAILLFFFITLGCSSKPDTGSDGYRLDIKNVVVDPNFKNDSKYEYGKNLYPNYSYEGLPENFLIKKEPDISFGPGDIESVTIKKGISFKEDVDVYEIVVSLSESSGKRLNDYTIQNQNKRVAMGVNNEIFYIATIIEPIKKELLLVIIGKKSIDQIKDIFIKLSDNVKVAG